MAEKMGLLPLGRNTSRNLSAGTPSWTTSGDSPSYTCPPGDGTKLQRNEPGREALPEPAIAACLNYALKCEITYPLKYLAYSIKLIYALYLQRFLDFFL